MPFKIERLSYFGQCCADQMIAVDFVVFGHTLLNFIINYGPKRAFKFLMVKISAAVLNKT